MKELTLQLTEAERHKLIEQYQPYVHKLALQVFQKLGGHFDLEELVSYGNLGLVEAAERFNPQRGVSFITFCHYRVKGAIFDGLRQMGLRQVPTNNRISSWEYAANNLIQASSDDELSELGNTSVEDEVAGVEDLIDNLIPVYLLSLDSEDVLNAPDQSRRSAQEEIETNELIKLLHQVLAEMPEQEKELIEAIYFKHIPMTQIAIEKGITKSWVSRLHARAVQHIRDKLKEIGFLITEEN